MSDMGWAFLIAFVTAVPPTVVAVAALVTAFRAKAKADKVQETVIEKIIPLIAPPDKKTE